jgi:hypothetical protein
VDIHSRTGSKESASAESAIPETGADPQRFQAGPVSGASATPKSP